MMLSVYVIVVYMSCAYSVSVHRVSLCTLRVRMIVFSECYFISYDNKCIRDIMTTHMYIIYVLV